MTTLPNGDLVVGGEFTVAGGARGNGIALWDGTAWRPLGLGLAHHYSSPLVHHLSTLPNGDLVAIGSFSSAGGVPADGLALWDGSTWTALGWGVSWSGPGGHGWIRCLAALPNGDLVIGGNFTAVSGVPCNNIARWDGISWHPLGSGVAGGEVGLMEALPNGDLVVAGSFSSAGGVPCNYIARWDGSSWDSMGSGMSWAVTSLTTDANGDLVAGGMFAMAGGVACSRIARWDGSTWSPLGSGLDHHVFSLTTLPNGDLVAGGTFSHAGGVACGAIARWDGTAWSALQWGVDLIVHRVAALPNGDLVAAGHFTRAGSVPCVNIARWDGSAWSAMGTGMNGAVHAATTLPNGDLVVGGRFSTVGHFVGTNVARWDGSSWHPLGGGIYGGICDFTVLPNGDLVAGGDFEVARWDGVAWSILGSRLGYRVAAVTSLANGDVVAGGTFTIAGGAAQDYLARWDGTSWTPWGPSLAGQGAVSVGLLKTLESGDVVIGGGFTTANGVVCNGILRWDGASVTPLGGGLTHSGSAGAPWDLIELPNGDLVVGGIFTMAGSVPCSNIARWDGVSWTALGAGADRGVMSVEHLPNGDLVIGGSFWTAGGVPCSGIARWDGASWNSFGSGVEDNLSVNCLEMLPCGELAVGGDFLIAGGLASPYLARLVTPCPAKATLRGAGCPAVAGPMALRSDTLPWLGGTWSLTGSTFPTYSLGFVAIGLDTQRVPLTTFHPAAGSGCDLLVTTEAIAYVPPLGQEVTFAMPIPNAPVLAGVHLQVQMLSIELCSCGSLTSMRSTNAIEGVIGTF